MENINSVSCIFELVTVILMIAARFGVRKPERYLVYCAGFFNIFAIEFITSFSDVERLEYWIFIAQYGGTKGAIMLALMAVFIFILLIFIFGTYGKYIQLLKEEKMRNR